MRGTWAVKGAAVTCHSNCGDASDTKWLGIRDAECPATRGTVSDYRKLF